MTFQEDSKLMSAYTQLTKKCPRCGHSLSFKTQGLERVECKWCGELVFISQKAKNKWKQREFRSKYNIAKRNIDKGE